MKFTFLFAALIMSLTCEAQSLTNRSVISIGASSVLYVKESITNHGTIINNGDMQVGGSWENLAQYDAGTGKITFNSDAPQIINHNDQSFTSLTIAGGGEKIFQADITIEEGLNLESGILVSSGDARIIIRDNAQVTGGSDIAHVNGPVYHTRAGNNIFPLGDGTKYLPVELINMPASASGIGIQAFDAANVALSAGPSLESLSSLRYWSIDGASSLTNTMIILPVDDETLSNDPEKIVVAQSASLSDDFESIGQSSFSGTLSSGRVTSDQPLTQAFVTIGVMAEGGSPIVFNAVSANGDDLNAFVRIRNIERYPENTFEVFNRWGDKVFEIENYNNVDRVFNGTTNIGGAKALVSGTYFYVLKTKRDSLTLNGFLVVKN